MWYDKILLIFLVLLFFKHLVLHAEKWILACEHFGLHSMTAVTTAI